MESELRGCGLCLMLSNYWCDSPNTGLFTELATFHHQMLPFLPSLGIRLVSTAYIPPQVDTDIALWEQHEFLFCIGYNINSWRGTLIKSTSSAWCQIFASTSPTQPRVRGHWTTATLCFNTATASSIIISMFPNQMQWMDIITCDALRPTVALLSTTWTISLYLRLGSDWCSPRTSNSPPLFLSHRNPSTPASATYNATEDTVAYLLHTTKSHLHNRKENYVKILLLNYSSAFNTINISILTEKL